MVLGFVPLVYALSAAASASPLTLHEWVDSLLRPSLVDLGVRLIFILLWLLLSWLLIRVASPVPVADPPPQSSWERRVLDSNPDAVIIGNDSWHIVECNLAAVSLYGVPRDALLGKTVWTFMDRDASGVASGNWDRLPLLEPAEGEARIRRPDGSSLLVWRKAVPLRSPSGSFSGFIFFDRDITAQKQESEALRVSQEHLAGLVENARDIIFKMGPDGRISSLNPAFETVTGLKRSEWVGKMLGALLVPDDLPAFAARLRSLASGHPETTFTTRVTGRRDDEISVDISLIPEYRHRVLTAIFGIARDITDRKRSEDRIRTQHQEISTLHCISEIVASARSLDASFDKILAEISNATGFPLVLVELYDAERGVTSLRAAKGIPLDTVQGLTAVSAADTLSGSVARSGKTTVDLHADEAQKFKNPILHGASVKTFVCVPLPVESSIIGVISLGHPQSVPVDETRVRWIETLARYVASLIARKQAEEKLRQNSETLLRANIELERSKSALQQLAIRDELTNLYNRREMNHILAEEMDRAKRYNRSINLALMDLDYFKTVNDTYGHQVGNEALRALAKFLHDNIRGADRPCRYGGEELAIVLPEISLREAAEMAERLRRLIEQSTFRAHKRSGEPLDLRLTVSIGIASYPDHARTVAALISAADAALYQAKTSGRNRVILARSSSS